MMEKATKELRLTELRAIQDNDEMIVEGYAVIFESETDLGWCKEIVSKGAFSNCNMQDVCMKYNHLDAYPIMARTRNKSLNLIVDDKGLKIRAKLVPTQANKDIYTLIQNGTLDKMSYAFTVSKDEWDYDTDTRRILEIDKLFDVSVVDLPAYDGTSIYSRSLDLVEAELEAMEVASREAKAKIIKQKINIKSKI